ncbi:MAG: acyltransferase [Bacteroidales bacterium]|nr:acyltransferase [Bacteroidales bacterium]
MRIEQLTFTRFFAAIIIVIYHSAMSVFPFSHHSLAFIFNHASIGVSYFFTLSGFVMVIAYHSNSRVSVFDFLKNRFARIYPVFFLAIVILLAYARKVNYRIDNADLCLSLHLLQAWVPGKALTLNIPGWSLSVEWFFYIVFPFAFNYLYSKIKYKKLVVPVFLIWALSQVALNVLDSSAFYKGYPSKSHDLLYYFPLMHLNEFLAGNLLGLFFVNRLKNKHRNFDWAIAGVIFTMLLALYFNRGINVHNGIFAVFFCPLIVLLSLNTGKISSLLRAKPMVFLGEISYGIYILQFPLTFWSLELCKVLKIDDYAAKFYVYLTVLLICSALSYVFLEKPIRNWLKRLKITITYHK